MPTIVMMGPDTFKLLSREPEGKLVHASREQYQQEVDAGRISEFRDPGPFRWREKGEQRAPVQPSPGRAPVTPRQPVSSSPFSDSGRLPAGYRPEENMSMPGHMTSELSQGRPPYVPEENMSMPPGIPGGNTWLGVDVPGRETAPPLPPPGGINRTRFMPGYVPEENMSMPGAGMGGGMEPRLTWDEWLQMMEGQIVPQGFRGDQKRYR
jgi:hypothetical protein